MPGTHRRFPWPAAVTQKALTVRLAGQRHFVLDRAQWSAFVAALDRPVQSVRGAESVGETAGPDLVVYVKRHAFCMRLNCPVSYIDTF